MGHYSDEMLSEFHQLSEKVSTLAELVTSLKRENAELRVSVTALTSENADLARRIEEAYRRLSALIEKIPAAESEEPA